MYGHTVTVLAGDPCINMIVCGAYSRRLPTLVMVVKRLERQEVGLEESTGKAA